MIKPFKYWECMWCYAGHWLLTRRGQRCKSCGHQNFKREPQYDASYDLSQADSVDEINAYFRPVH